MTSRLIRRDNGRLICINDYRSIQAVRGEEEEGHSAYFQTDPELKPTAKTLSGTI